MSVPRTPAQVLAEAERALQQHGRVVLCQIVRAEGSTPGKVGWKLLARPDGSFYGNLGGGAWGGAWVGAVEGGGLGGETLLFDGGGGPRRGHGDGVRRPRRGLPGGPG